MAHNMQGEGHVAQASLLVCFSAYRVYTEQRAGLGSSSRSKNGGKPVAQGGSE